MGNLLKFYRLNGSIYVWNNFWHPIWVSKYYTDLFSVIFTKKMNCVLGLVK